jgi:hypothetical protein
LRTIFSISASKEELIFSSSDILSLKILRFNPPNDALIETNEISRKINADIDIVI